MTKKNAVPASVQVLVAFISGMFSAYVYLNTNKRRNEFGKQMKLQEPKRKRGFNRKETQTYCTSMSPEEVMDLIVSRRSYKPELYSGRIVSDLDIRKILEAANWGMSHCNSQPWRFVVFSDIHVLFNLTTEYIKKHQERIFPWAEYAEYNDFLEAFEKRCSFRWNHCSHIIAIGMKRKTLAKRTNPLWEEKCAVATSIQNASLMATSLKVACYWSSWYEPFRESEEFVDSLGLDFKAGDRCLGVFCLGHSDKFGKLKAKRNGFDAKVTYFEEGN